MTTRTHMHVLVAVELPTNTDEAFGIIVPGIPGCFSAGDTLEEALNNVSDAIEFHTEAEPLDHSVSLVDMHYLIDPPEDLNHNLWKVVNAWVYCK